ncbi:MAG: PAS domain-containing sensor histidine kinase [Elusimicrobia bacterium]|nr:PAS domain-containing sensor histidine kinase [Elusimicrobiota bacterium]
MGADFLASLRPLFDCLTDGFCIADADGRLLYANAAAGRLLGPKARAEAARTSICELLCAGLAGNHGLTAATCPLKVPRGAKDAVTFKGKFAPSGRDLRARCLRVRLPSAERHFLIIEDVTAHAERGRQKEEWRQMLAHDFRAPLSVMFGALRSLEDLGEGHALDKDDLEIIDSGVRNSRRLDDLIESYLETTRLEDGALPVRASAVDVGLLIAAIVDDEKEVARSHGLTLTAGPASGLTARADPELLRRAVTNLIGNAMKFTLSGGRIRVGASAAPGAVLIRVSDDGQGIPARELPHIFDRFYQCESHRRGHGLGLGLTFCRAALRAMGGDVTVESEEGKGSVFTLSLPEAAAAEAKP